MKRTLIFLSSAALFLASCTSATPAAKIPTNAGIAPTQPQRVVPTETLGAALANNPTSLPSLATTTPWTIKPGDMMPGCTVISVKPTPSSPQDSVFGAVTAQDWVVGPPTATVTLLEYSDFQ